MWLGYLGWTIQNLLFPLVVPVVLLTGVILAVWIERRGAAFIQDRVGPNRIHIFGFRNAGLLQPIADALKLLVKEEFMRFQQCGRGNRGPCAQEGPQGLWRRRDLPPPWRR